MGAFASVQVEVVGTGPALPARHRPGKTQVAEPRASSDHVRQEQGEEIDRRSQRLRSLAKTCALSAGRMYPALMSSSIAWVYALR